MRYYAFFLLALIVGTVCGDEIAARVTGFTEDGDYCPTRVLDKLYDDCVVDEAVALGASFEHRRELRDSRDLFFNCGICPTNPPLGHWCYVYW
jgi:hypothetical protein